MKKLEKMDDFFTARVDDYDEHMLTEVGGCAAGYKKMAELAAEKLSGDAKLLDLGCGTGLELDELYKLLPELRVTGIDMTEIMLDELRRKHPDKEMTLLVDDYRTADFGGEYDAAVSFQTMHHLTSEEKLGIYEKIYDSLKDGGFYIECDYMCDTDEQEEYFQRELARIKSEQKLSDELYHYDTPCTVIHQLETLFQAGFNTISRVFREENTVMLIARKKIKKPYVQSGLEPMDTFFANRVVGYDEHMLGHIKKIDRAYACGAQMLAKSNRIVSGGRDLLDLGCGTGMELADVYRLLPDMRVTGIDMTQAMLDVLTEKFSDKSPKLICGSYFDIEFGEKSFDAAISYESLHHFTAERKLSLYKRIYRSLKPGGVFIDGDKMADTEETERECFAELARIRIEQNLAPDVFFHFDTPLTPEHEAALMKQAGFSRVEKIYEYGTVTVLAAVK